MKRQERTSGDSKEIRDVGMKGTGCVTYREWSVEVGIAGKIDNGVLSARGWREALLIEPRNNFTHPTVCGGFQRCSAKDEVDQDE